MTKRRGQEARPGAVHFQRLHLEEWNVWELDIELELEGGVGGAWGGQALCACLPDLACQASTCCQASLLSGLYRCPSYISGCFFYPDCPPSISTSVLLMPKLYPQ